MSVSRRNFLKGAAAGSAGTALAGGALIGGARADARGAADDGAAEAASYPFHGIHQAGVLTPGRRLTDTRKSYLVHFDVDAIDFADAPLSENTDRNVGLTLDAALEALAGVLHVPGLAALTVTELNPDHAAAVPGLLERFTSGLAAALAN